MKEYIDKTALMKKVHTGMNIIEVMQAIIDAPAADVVEVRRGRWNNGYEVQNCSECGYRGKRSYHYCPKCGARMDGGADDGT